MAVLCCACESGLSEQHLWLLEQILIKFVAYWCTVADIAVFVTLFNSFFSILIGREYARHVFVLMCFMFCLLEVLNFLFGLVWWHICNNLKVWGKFVVTYQTIEDSVTLHIHSQNCATTLVRSICNTVFVNFWQHLAHNRCILTLMFILVP